MTVDVGMTVAVAIEALHSNKISSVQCCLGAHLNLSNQAFSKPKS